MQLTDQHIGSYVTVITEKFGATVEGTYEGVRPSEWDGASYHYFRGGSINGTNQGENGLHGFPVTDAHYLTCDADPRLWGSTERCTQPATTELDECPVCKQHYNMLREDGLAV